jgi:hypothetical protein
MSRVRFGLGHIVTAVAAAVVLGMPCAAVADIVTVDSFSVSDNGSLIFTDTFSKGLTLTQGTDASGLNFLNDGPASYGVAGTIVESGSRAILDTAKGEATANPLGQPDSLVAGNLLTPLRGTNSLTSLVPFSVTGVFDLSVPSLGGGYGIRLTQPSINPSSPYDVLHLEVFNTTGAPVVQLSDFDFAADTITVLDSASLDTSHQEIFLEMELPVGHSNQIEASYAYIDNGVEGPPTTFATDGSEFEHVGEVQAGFSAVDPIPEPASLALFATALLAALSLRRRGNPNGKGKHRVSRLGGERRQG